MSKKTFALCVGCVNGAATIATAVVTFVQPNWAAAIVAGIGIVATAVIEVMSLFTKDE